MIDKTPLNWAQFQLVASWLPSGSQPYAYDTTRLWYWEPHYSGVVVKKTKKITPEQLKLLRILESEN